MTLHLTEPYAISQQYLLNADAPLRRLGFDNKPIMATPDIGVPSVLSDQDKQDLHFGFKDMYWGLTWLAWMNSGVTLGNAWKVASSQADGIIKDFSKQFGQNIAIDYLIEFISSGAGAKDRNENSDSFMDVPSGQFARYEKMGQQLVRDGVRKLELKIEMFKIQINKRVRFPKYSPARKQAAR